jgi:hypothetical protein
LPFLVSISSFLLESFCPPSLIAFPMNTLYLLRSSLLPLPGFLQLTKAFFFFFFPWSSFSLLGWARGCFLRSSSSLSGFVKLKGFQGLCSSL